MDLRQNRWGGYRFSMAMAMGLAVAAWALVELTAAGAVVWLPTSGTNDWFEPTNWSAGSVPGPGSDVVITNRNAGVLLTNSTPLLASLTISNQAMLVFSNWDTALSAVDILVGTNGTVTHTGPFADEEMTNAVRIVCTTLVVAAGGRIDAEAKGFKADGSTGPTTRSSGPGGAYYRGGGSHGGRGGYVGSSTIVEPGPTNGSPRSPTMPGSGGGNNTGGHGGGVVIVEASGAVTVNGTISARGGDRRSGSYAGAGAGGSVFITCRTFQGSGLLTAAGGTGTGGLNCGGGGGGRIAVVYDPASQAELPVPAIGLDTLGGLGTAGWEREGWIGTIHLPDARFLKSEIVGIYGQMIIDGFSEWALRSLVVSNASVRFSEPGFTLTVTNDLLITGARTRLALGGDTETSADPFPFSQFEGTPSVEVGGRLIITNTGSLYLHAAMTNEPPALYGALLDVGGEVVLAPASWIYLISHCTRGCAPFVRTRDMSVRATGGITADGGGWLGRWGNLGYRSGTGAYGGAGYYRGGGGYGGDGGYVGPSLAYERGLTNGNALAPMTPGSGGGNDSLGKGGGLVWLEVSRRLTLSGTITANGFNGVNQYSGGGAGGGIYIRTKRLQGNGAVVTANGGAGTSVNAGGGGGGRIAIWRIIDEYTGSLTTNVLGGAGTHGTSYYRGIDGTSLVEFSEIAPAAILFQIE